MSPAEERALARTICKMLGACVDWKNTNRMAGVRLDCLTNDKLIVAVVSWWVPNGPLVILNDVEFTITRNPLHWTVTPGLGDVAESIKAELDTKLQEWVVNGVVNGEVKA